MSFDESIGTPFSDLHHLGGGYAMYCRVLDICILVVIDVRIRGLLQTEYKSFSLIREFS
jgi:hypothetical protein